MLKVRACALLLAVSAFIAGCASTPTSAEPQALAYTSTPDGKHAVVLTDGTFEYCPKGTNVAVLTARDGTVQNAVLGCWAYSGVSRQVAILWLSTETKDTFGTLHDADDFVKIAPAL